MDAPISVSACNDAVVSEMIKGEFDVTCSNHGKPVYTKNSSKVTVFIYYWDDRDGAESCGWWFGHKVGGDQVWAYTSQQTPLPPTKGWQVPWDGDVDMKLRLRFGAAAGSVAQAPAVRLTKRKAAPPMEAEDPRMRMAGAQEIAESRRRARVEAVEDDEGEDDRRQEEEEARRREADRKRREENALRAEAELLREDGRKAGGAKRRRIHQEDDPRRLEEDAEARRRLEMRARRAEDEAKRRREEEEEEEQRRQFEEKQAEKKRRRDEERRRQEEEEARISEKEEARRKAEQEAEEARRREERRRREEEARRRREEEAAKRREEEELRLEEERRMREKNLEEDRRREEERRKEAEVRMREIAAADAVRQVMRKLRTVNPGSYDRLVAELDAALEKHRPLMGSQTEKCEKEAETATENAKERVNEILEQRKAEEEAERKAEEKRQEDERMMKKFKEFLDDTADALDDLEGKADNALAGGKAVPSLSEATPDVVVKASTAAAKFAQKTHDELEASSTALKDEYAKMVDVDAVRTVRGDVRDLEERFNKTLNSLVKALKTLTELREKSGRKAKVLSRMVMRREAFEAANISGGTTLNSGDVAAFAQTQYQYTLPEEALSSIVAALEPITLEKFQRMRGMVAIKRSEALAREKRQSDADKKPAEDDKKPTEEPRKVNGSNGKAEKAPMAAKDGEDSD